MRNATTMHRLALPTPPPAQWKIKAVVLTLLVLATAILCYRVSLLDQDSIGSSDRHESSEQRLIAAVHAVRQRIGWTQPQAASSPSRQLGTLGWFMAQLSPGQPIPPSWTARHEQIASALEGSDLSFPLWAASQLPSHASPKEILEAWVNADLLESDPHARYLPPAQAMALDKILRLYDEGLGLAVVEDTSGSPPTLRIASVSPSSPAATAGMVPGGQMLGWRPTRSGPWLTPPTASAWRTVLSGAPGTGVGLRWSSPEGRATDVWLVRSLWTLQDKRPSDLMIHAAGLSLGVIRIHEFYARTATLDTATDVKTARDRLRTAGAEVLVLDLRGNPGGYWEQALQVAGIFDPKETVAFASPPHTKGIPVGSPFTENPWRAPVWVWVDRNTASASEVLAGFLRFHHHACLVGERTFGKGSIQLMAPLSGPFGNGQAIPGTLVLTTMIYTWTNGQTPQWWGLAPDTWMSQPDQTLAIGERALPGAIKPSVRPPEPAIHRFSGLSAASIQPSSSDSDWVAASLETPACQRPEITPRLSRR